MILTPSHGISTDCAYVDRTTHKIGNPIIRQARFKMRAREHLWEFASGNDFGS